MKKLSELSKRIDGQPMFKLLDKVKKLEKEGKNIIHFEIGDPDFGTPVNIVDAGINAIENGFTHYTSSYGLTEFREKICDATLKSRHFKPDIEQILVTPGANIAIFYAITCLVDQGKEVIVPDPGFPSYYSTIKMCNVTPVRVPLKEENEFRMNPDDIEKNITENTRLVIINSPQNPTGSVMTEDQIKHTYEIAEKHDVYLYSDEIYARMIYDNTKFNSPSIYDKCKDRTIISNGFSKAFAMTGWRLGAIIGPSIVIEKMKLLLETTSSCVSPFIQKAGIEAISGDQSRTINMYKEYNERRELIVDGLNSITSISCVKPSGAFYVFPNIKNTGMTSIEFANYILDDANVAVLPGTNFGEHGEGYVRLCYATTKEKINEAIKRIDLSMRKLNL